MRGRNERALIFGIALLPGLACVGGVYRDPVGRASGGSSERSTLSGTWKDCGHLGAGAAWRLAISADGAFLAALFANGELAVHRIADGALVTRFQASTDLISFLRADMSGQLAIQDIALSSDGSVVAVADGRHVAAWRVADVTAVFDVPGPYGRVILSPNGELFLTWNAAGGPDVFMFELRAARDGHLLSAAAASAVGFAAGGAEIVTWNDNQVTFLSADQTGAVLRQVPLPGPLNGPTFSPDGAYLAARDQLGNGLHVYRTEDGMQLWEETESVGEIKFSPDGSKLLAPAKAFVADSETGATVLRALDRVRDMASGRGGTPIFVADASGLYRADDLQGTFSPVATLPGQGFPIMALAVSRDETWLAVASDASSPYPAPDLPIRVHPEDLLLWNLPDQALQRTFSSVGATSVQFSSDGRRVLIANRHEEPQGRLEEWELDGEAPLWSVATDGTRIYGASYSPSGAQVAVSFADGVGLMARGGTTVAPTMAREIVYPASAFSPDGAWLATSGPSLWSMADQAQAWTTVSPPLPSSAADVPDNAIVFSPDGATIMSSEVTVFDLLNTAIATRLYRASDGMMLRDLVGTLKRRPAFSPDGKWLLAADVVWEIATGRTVMLHPDPRPTSVSVFLSDGRIALARQDGIIEMFCPH
jgi:WD40 repeat protein